MPLRIVISYKACKKNFDPNFCFYFILMSFAARIFLIFQILSELHQTTSVLRETEYWRETLDEDFGRSCC